MVSEKNVNVPMLVRYILIVVYICCLYENYCHQIHWNPDTMLCSGSKAWYSNQCPTLTMAQRTLATSS